MVMAAAGVVISVADATFSLRGILQASEMKASATTTHDAKKAAKMMAEYIAKLTVDVINVILVFTKSLKTKQNDTNADNTQKIKKPEKKNVQNKIWERVEKTAGNIQNTEVPTTFTTRLDNSINYVNPKTKTNVLWTNANATEHMGEYISRFGKTSDSIGIRSQVMLESYSAALNAAMNSLAEKSPGRYFGMYGNWELGINTETGIVYHARMIY